MFRNHSSRQKFSVTLSRVAFALSHRGGGWGRSSTNPLSSINFPCVWSRGLPDPWVRVPCGCSRFHFSNISLGLGAVFLFNLGWLVALLRAATRALIRLQRRRERLAIHAKLFVVVLGDVAVLPDASVSFLRSILGRAIVIHLENNNLVSFFFNVK